MILALKTADDSTQLSLWQAADQKLAEELWQSGRKLADGLLGHIEDLLFKQSASFKDLTGLIVFAGPGSFTGLRIGTTIANSIAYANGCPIVSAGGDDWIQIGFKKLASTNPGDFVMPKYGAEPNITKPKK